MSDNESWGEEHLRPLYNLTDEARIDLIAQNGNDAIIYVWRDLERIKVKPSIKLCERVLRLQGATWRDSWRQVSNR